MNKKDLERFHGMWDVLQLPHGSLQHPVLVGDRAQEIARVGNIMLEAHNDWVETHTNKEMKAAFILSGINPQEAQTMWNECPVNTTVLFLMMKNLQ